ncbi:MAG: hypothetical protein QOD72_1675 [Acidimicrobiaceae bacterium]|nr:hypothetical protein [Acidimicrobiaceae bacterium]
MTWPVIEVVIGLAFFFWLMSLVASAINEGVSSAFALRARGLEAALVRMLGADHTNDLLSTSLVSSQRKNSRPVPVKPADHKWRWSNLRPFRSRGPSYLASSTFADALQQLFGARGAGSSLDLGKIGDPELREVLGELADKVGNDAPRFRAEVEGWFDHTMERATGWYKRRTQAILLVIGLALAAGANLSALTVGQRLWTDSSLRSIVGAEAQQATTAAAVASPTTSPTDRGPLERARDDFGTIHRLGFPAGWSVDNRPHGWGWWAAPLGWILTAFAVSLGASFWFDILNKAVKLRATGPVPAAGTPATPDAGASPPVPATGPNPPPDSPPAVLNRLANDRRSLVIVSATSLTGRADLARLYRLLDAAGPTIAELELSKQYGIVRSVVGHDATRGAVVEALKTAAIGDCVAVDLILMVHGEPDTLVLAAHDGPGIDEVPAVDLASDVIDVPELTGKLRLCYSTACFGQSHAPAFLAAGFTAVIGAKAINANSATELPLLLRRWSAGDPIGIALRRADNPEVRAATDFVAGHFGFTGVDSEKVLFGDRGTTIDTVAALGIAPEPPVQGGRAPER